jgi:ribosomal-protein-alanine N-acetyltransferase
MNKEEKANIKIAPIKENEYIIQDRVGITLGRIFIVEFNHEDKYCCFRIKFHKNDKEYEPALKKALELMINSLFKNKKLYKLNVIADEDIVSGPFIELGFVLEGVLWESIGSNNVRKNEFVFGIDEAVLSNYNNINILRLQGENIELKILTPDNAEGFLEYYTNNKKYLEPFEPIRSKEFFTLHGQVQDLTENYKQFLNGTSVGFGIYKDRKVIGKIRLSNMVGGVFQNAFVGYSIDEKEQGKGYMKEALNLVLDYAFEDMELHRIEASTLVDNERSQRVLEACGFKEIGISEKYLFINGKWRDHKVFYKVNE